MKKQLLRTLVLSCVFCLVSVVSKAQWVSIPDTNFGAWLNAYGYSQCLQGDNAVGWQMDTSCTILVTDTSMFISFGLSSKIRDLTGIEYIRNIRFLELDYLAVTTLPRLPDSLRWMQAIGDSIVTITALPSHLEQLHCGVNNITTLPQLPATL